MATAQDIITRAFAQAGIKTQESPLEASEIQDGLDLLNDLGSSYEYDLKLGFQPVMNISDVVRIPREAEHAFKTNLAVRLQSEYLLPTDQTLFLDAQDSMDRLVRSRVHIGDVDFPNTLPMGSGNQCDSGYYRDFFPSKDGDNF